MPTQLFDVPCVARDTGKPYTVRVTGENFSEAAAKAANDHMVVVNAEQPHGRRVAIGPTTHAPAAPTALATAKQAPPLNQPDEGRLPITFLESDRRFLTELFASLKPTEPMQVRFPDRSFLGIKMGTSEIIAWGIALGMTLWSLIMIALTILVFTLCINRGDIRAWLNGL